ncbi:hypothetical protein MKEN_01338600 [Mycena kentingensis (nom. inval.)]|nr:hypothetical protein MKEN_01338600 [Mycena kentingensis (nom. inval.)]
MSGTLLHGIDLDTETLLEQALKDSQHQLIKARDDCAVLQTQLDAERELLGSLHERYAALRTREMEVARRWTRVDETERRLERATAAASLLVAERDSARRERDELHQALNQAEGCVLSLRNELWFLRQEGRSAVVDTPHPTHEAGAGQTAAEYPVQRADAPPENPSIPRVVVDEQLMDTAHVHDSSVPTIDQHLSPFDGGHAPALAKPTDAQASQSANTNQDNDAGSAMSISDAEDGEIREPIISSANAPGPVHSHRLECLHFMSRFPAPDSKVRKPFSMIPRLFRAKLAHRVVALASQRAERPALICPDLTDWCSYPSQNMHAIVYLPAFKLHDGAWVEQQSLTDPAYGASGIDFFAIDHGQVLYAGIYHAHDLSKIQSSDTFPTNVSVKAMARAMCTSISEDGRSVQDKSFPAAARYANGSPRVLCFGLQCIGFNSKLLALLQNTEENELPAAPRFETSLAKKRKKRKKAKQAAEAGKSNISVPVGQKVAS